MSFKKIGAAAAVAGALLGTSMNSSAIMVGGVEFNSGAVFEFTNMWESFAQDVGDELEGYGRVTQIDNATNAQFCVGCELTFHFHDYFVTSKGSGDDFVFDGGVVDFYVDNSTNFDATDASTAMDGDLWLQLVGDEFTKTTSGGETETGTLLAFNVDFFDGVNFGEGRFDVSGGMAASYFDSNTVFDTPTKSITDGVSDFTFTSSFQLAGTPTNVDFPVQGTGELQGFVIPEPGTVALLGISALSLFGMRRAKKA